VLIQKIQSCLPEVDRTQHHLEKTPLLHPHQPCSQHLKTVYKTLPFYFSRGPQQNVMEVD
ncbi:hypothetical protein MKX03_016427, partial [Papaver bracteatum]